jgi:uncharacterized SAM-binding protein YcdF (DUF218 family)
LFLLKKIISEILMPLPATFGILLAGVLLLWFTRRQVLAKTLVTVAAILFLLEGFGFFAYTALSRLEGMYHPVDIQEVGAARVRWVVVLAGGSSPDEGLPVTSQLSPETQARLVEGVRVLRHLPEARLVVSGGSVFGEAPSAGLMARLAIELGVDPNRIVLEAQSRDTGDEARLVRPIVGEEPFVLVTSAYHMPRSMALFKRLGMRPTAAPMGHYAIPSDLMSPQDFFPRAKDLCACEIVAHEIMGLLALQLTDAWSR